MKPSWRACFAATALIVGLTAAAGAGGYTMSPTVNVPRGGHATFFPSGWRCNNYGARVECFSGDAHPYVELTATRRGGVTVKVHTLRDPGGGRLTRTYVRGYPVYIFEAG